jgi:acyl-coenzyme A thioesterase PaaI-like protein
MVSDVVSVGGRLAVVDFRIYDAKDGRLLVVGSHTKASLPVKSKL